jgi:DNA modification methylase
MPNQYVDMVITSPPYNINRNYNNYDDNLERSAYIKWQVNLINELDRVLKPKGLILYNFSYGQNDPLLPYSIMEYFDKETNFSVVDTIVWKKPNAMPINTNRLRRICEFVYVISRRTENDKFTKNISADNYIEAANNDGIDVPFNESTFSTELVLKLLKIYAKKGNLIYDPFMGIGTVIRACLIYGCNYIGSELDWKQTNYFNNKRLEAIVSKLDTLQRYYNNILELDFEIEEQ